MVYKTRNQRAITEYASMLIGARALVVVPASKISEKFRPTSTLHLAYPPANTAQKPLIHLTISADCKPLFSQPRLTVICTTCSDECA